VRQEPHPGDVSVALSARRAVAGELSSPHLSLHGDPAVWPRDFCWCRYLQSFVAVIASFNGRNAALQNEPPSSAGYIGCALAAA
jgi:hypothetical protein